MKIDLELRGEPKPTDGRYGENRDLEAKLELELDAEVAWEIYRWVVGRVPAPGMEFWTADENVEFWAVEESKSQ